jgi:hypothetical protein
MTNAREKLSRINIAVNPTYVKRKNRFLIRIEDFVYQHKNKLVLVHASLFLLFLMLIVLPLLLPQPAEQATLFTNFTLFAQFLLWGIWFPLVFASVIFSGRSWCGLLCPMGAASEWATKIGLQRKIPGWLKWEGTPILSFLLVTILGQTVDVRDQATAIAEIFGGTLLLALLIGYFYGKKSKRAWCRHVCPIGLLLGIFSRLGAVQFAPKQLRLRGDQYTEKGICPTMISISQKQESRHCIQCFRCVKPTSRGGLFIHFRRLGEEIIHIREHSPSLGEVWFIFLSTGISLGGFLWLILPSYQTLRQMIGEWCIKHGWNWIGNSGPGWLMSVHPELRQTYNWLDFFMIVSFMLSCMLLTTFVLSTCTLVSSYLAGYFQADKTLKERFTELGYQFAPVAMISIIIGLGDTLFSTLRNTLNIGGDILSGIKATLFIGSISWSIYLGRRLLMRQGVSGFRNWLALSPGILGSLFIGLAWWPAILGVNISLLEQYRQQLVFLN